MNIFKINELTGPVMRTYSGKLVNIMEPDPATIEIEDIAHSLANLCRFAGHTARFYSVAEHSLLMSEMVPEHLALQALMHDAAEAYMVDLPRPVKKLFPYYTKLENNLLRVIFQRFGIPFPLPDEVKEADDIMLHAEWDNVFETPLNSKIEFLVPAVAEAAFLGAFHELKQK